jgi:DNA-binding CsgD family transcriptional regulator
VDPVTRLVSSLTLVRKETSPAFREEVRRLKERLTPHLVEAQAANMLHQVEWRAGAPFPYAAAIADEGGLLEFVSSGFAPLIRREWPDWLGPRLPNILLAPRAPALLALKEITLLTERVGPSLWLHARRRMAIDALSAREAEVAHLSALGRANKEIGQRLSLSPFTVRNHLESVYRNLGLSRRSELGALAGELARLAGRADP